MKFIEPNSKERKEFQKFIKQFVSQHLVSITQDKVRMIRQFFMNKEDVPAFIKVLNTYGISHFIKEDDESDEKKGCVRYLEEYFQNDDLEKDRFNRLKKELIKHRFIEYGSSHVHLLNYHEFDESYFEGYPDLFIVDSIFEEQVKNIVRHVTGHDVNVHHIDIVKRDFEIFGLIWFRIPGLYEKQDERYPFVSDTLQWSNINHIMVRDRGGKLAKDLSKRNPQLGKK